MRHNRAEGEGTATDERAKDDRIQEQFASGTDGLAEADHWLSTDESEEQVLKHSPKCKFCWLKDIQVARASEEQMRRSAIGRKQNNMRQWLENLGDENT